MKKLYSIIVVLSIAALLKAQPTCTIRTFTVRDGLAANTISGLCQSGDGLMWISTWNGLSCYDGYTFTTFRDTGKWAKPDGPTKTADTQSATQRTTGGGESLTSNRLMMIRANSHNDVWCVSYDRQLYLFDTHRCRFVDIGRLIAQKFNVEVAVRTVFSLSNGYSWIVSRDGKPAFRIKDDTAGSEQPDIEMFTAAGQQPKGAAPAKQTLKGSQVNKVYLDGDKREWVFTDRGATLVGGTFASTVVYDYLVQAGQTVIMASPTGQAAIWQKGWNKEQRLTMPAGVTAVNSLTAIDDRRVVAATNLGVVLISVGDDAKGTRAQLVIATGQEVKALATDSRGRVWAFTEGDGVMMADTESWTPHFLTTGPYNPLTATRSETPFFHEDAFGTIWVVPSSGVFSYYDEKATRLVPYTLQTATAFNPWVYAEGQTYTDLPVINKFMTDSQKNLWFTGTRDLTLVNFSYRRLAFTTVVPNQEARAVLRDSKGHTWIGMASGELAIADATGRIEGYLTPQGTLQTAPMRFSNRIYALFEDSRGRLLIGTKGDGIYVRAADGHITHYRHDDADPNSLSHDDIYDFDEDPGGRLWIATFGDGPNVLDADGRFLNHRNSFLRDYPHKDFGKVRRITHDADGNMYFSTNNGLVLLTGKGGRYHTCTHHPDDPKSLLTSDVMQTLVTSDKAVFVVTMGGGVQRLSVVWGKDIKTELETVAAFSADDGRAQSMADDHRGNIWVVREATVDRYDTRRDTLETFGPNEFGERTKFTEALPATDPLTGDIVLAVAGGSVTFQPSQMQKSQYCPKLLFTGVKYQGRQQVDPVLNTDVLDVPSDQRNLTIYFSALDYRDNHQIRYAYAIRKAGSDSAAVDASEWNYVGSAHSASFNHLPPGRLQLLVRSTNSDGVWVDNMAILDICSHPTFWETPWATLLYLTLLAAVVGTGFYIYRLRTRMEMRRELTDMKTRFFTEVVDEDQEMMRRLTAFLDQNIGNADLRMEDLADAVNLGRSVFSQKVKSIVGMPPVDFVRHVRIQHAEHLIRNSTQNFSQIAYAVGFSDPKYFSKCFKKETGLTPSEYRKKRED